MIEGAISASQSAFHCCYIWWIAGLTHSSSDLIWIDACGLGAWRHYIQTDTCLCKSVHGSHTLRQRQTYNQMASDKHAHILNTHLHRSMSNLGHPHRTTLCAFPFLLISVPLESHCISPQSQKTDVSPCIGWEKWTSNKACSSNYHGKLWIMFLAEHFPLITNKLAAPFFLLSFEW